MTDEAFQKHEKNAMDYLKLLNEYPQLSKTMVDLSKMYPDLFKKTVKLKEDLISQIPKSFNTNTPRVNIMPVKLSSLKITQSNVASICGKNKVGKVDINGEGKYTRKLNLIMTSPLP